MNQENGQLYLFDQIRKEARWLKISPDIFDDVVQEAWLLSLDYAQNKGKKLTDLSKTEVKYRCLEAKRKISQSYKEISVEEEWFDSVVDEPTITQEIIRKEMKNTSLPGDYFDRLDWLLRVHPGLKLTDHQVRVSHLMLYDAKYGWQIKYAQKHGISRQAISKTVSIVRKKIAWAADLLRLIDGDVDYFFDRHGKEWYSKAFRINLISLFRPQMGTKVDPQLTKLFLPLQESITAKAIRTLEQEINHIKSGNSPRPDNMALGNNLLYTVEYMSNFSFAKSDTIKEISNKGKGLGPFFDLALDKSLYGGQAWMEQYTGWLSEQLKTEDQLGKDYANYHLAYYHAVPQNKARDFLQSAGTMIFEDFSYPVIITRTYDNMRNSFYNKHPELLDLNFLRLLLIKKHFPLQPQSLPLSSQQALKTIAQKSLHSKNHLVAHKAEEFLATIDH